MGEPAFALKPDESDEEPFHNEKDPDRDQVDGVSEPEFEVEVAPFLQIDDPPRHRGPARLAINPTLAKQILKMAMPVVLGMLTQTAINILDSVMVGRLPKAEANPGLAAIGLSLPLMWLVGGFLSAIWVGTQAITARRAGEGHDDYAGRVLTNSLVLAFLFGSVFSILAALAAPHTIGNLYSDHRVVELGVGYLQIRLLGVLAMVATFSYKSFFDGIGRTKIFMVVAVLMNILNVVFNYLLIFGHEGLGVPQMGVRGAALASVLAAYIGLFAMIFWSFTPSLLRRYRYYSVRKINFKVMGEIVRLSLPNGIATIVIMVGFEAFYWVVGMVNDRVAEAGNPVIAAGNQVVVVALMITFMTSLAFGTATAAIVGQALGAGRTYLAERYAFDATKIWAYVTWTYGGLLLMFPDQILGLVSTDPEVIAVAKAPIIILAFFQGVIAIAVVLAQVLYGTGNAKFVMWVELILHLSVVSPVAYLMGWVFDLGLVGIYAGPLLYVVLMAIAVGWKLRKGDWKEATI
ncbi:MATE family efflux transporter [Myxococcota bacterium]|nr:MATE family efflux transporter [Myxococcota bacterium]